MFLNNFLKAVEPYQKFIGIIIGLVTATLFVNDYFATRNEVENIRCQLDAKTEALKKQNEVNGISKQLVEQMTLSTTEPSPQLTVDIDILRTQLEQVRIQQFEFETKAQKSDCVTSGGR